MRKIRKKEAAAIKLKKTRLSHVQIIALGFLLMIALGTALLMLPCASADGQAAPFREAFFTATSASCVTGLVLRDTATAWTSFGHIVILLMIQLGGLGFMTMATLFYLLLNKRMGLRQREIMVESINTTQIGGIMKLSRLILAGTFTIELLGALILSIRFIPMFGPWKGLWYGLFHSVSAFCNAGFDLMGGTGGAFCSMVPFRDDVLVNVTLMLIIILGGLGFLVWDDLRANGLRWKRYRLHTKLVLVTSAILTFGGALLIFLMELHATGADLPLGGKVLTALFASVSARTAGFNTVDLAAQTDGTKLVTCLLMLVGGSPGSTAGGVKTVSIAVIVLFGIAAFRGEDAPTVFGRRIPEDARKKAYNVLFFNAGLALIAAVILCGTQGFDLADVLMETVSAISTVGSSTGLTRELSPFCSYLVALLMYLGRVGSVSFAVALLEKKARPPVRYPEETVIVG